MMYDCPKCGKPNSSCGDTFCTNCEWEYQQEEWAWRERAIEENRALMNCCPCRGGEACGACYRRLAAICYAQGKEADGNYWLNQ